MGGHVDQSSQWAQSMPKVECGEKCVNIKDYRWLSGETNLWRATQKEKGSGGKKYGGAVFVCKLIRERICKNETLTPLLSCESNWEKGRGKRERSERGRQSGRQWQRRKNLCKVLIVVSDWTGRPVILTLLSKAEWLTRQNIFELLNSRFCWDKPTNQCVTDKIYSDVSHLFIFYLL